MKLYHAPNKWLLLLTLILGSIFSEAQQTPSPVTGTVRNEKGDPLESVTIQQEGGRIATVTDAKGKFSLSVPHDAMLIFSYVGYDTLRLRAISPLNVSLRPLSSSMNDVVVIGYGSTRRKMLTGSVATVSAKDFQQGVITTPEQLIAGKVAGVSITSNGGAPGAGSTIRIRGGASLNASNDPLIVIDGVPLSGNNIYGASNPLSLVNPNDIATFTVLKDAAATAIYGSRASNGVILITTKKGSSGAPQFSFSTQVSLSMLAKKMDVQSPADFRKYVDSLGGGTFDNQHTYKSLLGATSTDWQDEIFQSAISTDNNLSVSGAVKNLPYRISVGYLDQKGILRTDHLQRMSGGISLSPVLLDKHLKIDINLKGAYNKARFANGSAISSAAYFDPTQPVHNGSDYGGFFEWTQTDASSGDVVLNKLSPRNPVALLELFNNSSDVYRSYGNIQFDYQFHFLPELHANLNLGYDVARGDGRTDVPAYAAQNFLEGGQQNKYSNRINNKVAEFYLNYTKDFAAIKSNVNLTAGYGYYNNLSTNDLYPFIRANGDTIDGSKPLFANDKPENTLISYYGRLIYTYNNKYILAASLRTDGSSRFSPDTRWGTFPSVAFTWLTSKENFLLNGTFLSDLKLRLSYGVTGNQDGIYNYPYQSIYSLSGNASQVLFGNTWYYMGTPAAYDANIKWEQTAAYNAGIDFGFLKDRLTGSLDVYFKKTEDLLNTIPIPAGSNFSSTILTNVGNIENKGIELSLNAQLIKGNRFSWDLGFNAAYNENKITNLTATKDSTYPGTYLNNGVQIHSVRYQASSFFVYHQQYANGRPVEGVYVDQNKDGIINQNDLYRYKSPFAKYILGLTSQWTYGKWTLSTVLRANIGNYMYNGIAVGAVRANILNPLGYLANTLNDVYNTGNVNSQQLSDYYVENASFLKMDNLGLAYNAGRILHEKVNLRLNANFQNVFTVTKYKGLDPEVNGGVDNIIYPRPRIFVVGASLQF